MKQITLSMPKNLLIRSLSQQNLKINEITGLSNVLYELRTPFNRNLGLLEIKKLQSSKI